MPMKDWSTTAATNATAGTINWAEGQMPSTVNGSARQLMADVRTWYEDAEWRDWGHVTTYASATSFTIPTDVTAVYTAGRRVRIVSGGTLYGTVSSSSYGAPNTTVNVTLDSGSLSNPVSSVAVGLAVNNNGIGGSALSSAMASPPAIGGTAAAAGTFTTLTATGLCDLSGATAGQIKFPAAQNASADPNTLDDYEEGSFTPTFTFQTPGNLSVAYTGQVGKYTKVGRVVFCVYACIFTPTHTTASGSAVFAGFPFACTDTSYAASGACGYQNIASLTVPAVATMGNATTNAYLFSGSTTALTTTNFPTAASRSVYFGITYHT